jgi:hypothetical protein
MSLNYHRMAIHRNYIDMCYFSSCYLYVSSLQCLWSCLFCSNLTKWTNQTWLTHWSYSDVHCDQKHCFKLLMLMLMLKEHCFKSFMLKEHCFKSFMFKEHLWVIELFCHSWNIFLKLNSQQMTKALENTTNFICFYHWGQIKTIIRYKTLLSKNMLTTSTFTT